MADEAEEIVKRRSKVIILAPVENRAGATRTSRSVERRSPILEAVRVLASFERELGPLNIEERALEQLRAMVAESAGILEEAKKNLRATTDRRERVRLRTVIKDLTSLLAEMRQAISDIRVWIAASEKFRAARRTLP